MLLLIKYSQCSPLGRLFSSM